MPDLPLPKPTAPVAAPPPPTILAAKPQVVSAPKLQQPEPPTPSVGLPADPKTQIIQPSQSQPTTAGNLPNPTETDEEDILLPPPSTLKPQPTTSPLPQAMLHDPVAATEMKPPAVVSALSSVSSNQLPTLKEEKKAIDYNIAPVRAQSPILQRLGGSTQPGLGQQVLSTPLNSVSTASTLPPVPTPDASVKTQPLPQTPTTPAPSKIAKTKKSPLRFLPFLIGGIILILVIIFGATRLLGGSKTAPVDSVPQLPPGTTDADGGSIPNGENPGDQQEAVTIEYWGLWEPNAVMESILDEFETQNPGITVQYVSQSHRDYRERLQTAIVSKTGPDVFRFHASWTPMLARELAPLPSSVLTATDFESAFYPVARAQLTINETIVGVPVMYDGLQLYYNKEIFQTAGVQPPKTWSELRTLATTLAINEGDQLKRGGVALGASSNVEHFSDILGLLMIQNGAKLEEPNSPEGRDALLFYTNFLTQDKVWNDSMPSSTVAFARGDVAMMLAPSWRAFEVQTLNPNLQFGTAPVPQLANERISWASYWAEGVNAMSDKQVPAWKLVQYLSSSATQKRLYASQAQVRSFGEPYSRKDLADELAVQPLVAPLLQDAPYARGWYMSSFTHDNGINDQINKYYADAVNAVIEGKDITTVMGTLGSGVQQVLVQYNLIAPQAQTAI